MNLDEALDRFTKTHEFRRWSGPYVYGREIPEDRPCGDCGRPESIHPYTFLIAPGKLEDSIDFATMLQFLHDLSVN